jgi:hypothetical protein
MLDELALDTDVTDGHGAAVAEARDSISRLWRCSTYSIRPHREREFDLGVYGREDAELDSILRSESLQDR